MRERLSTVRDLQQEVTQVLEGAGTRTLFTLASDMRNGRGNQEELDQLTADLPRHDSRPGCYVLTTGVCSMTSSESLWATWHSSNQSQYSSP